jgi:hypothetical protein
MKREEREKGFVAFAVLLSSFFGWEWVFYAEVFSGLP